MKYIKFLGNSKYLVPEDWNVSNYKYYSFTKTLPDESTVTGKYKTRGLIRNGKQEIIIIEENGISKTEYAFLDKTNSSISDLKGNDFLISDVENYTPGFDPKALIGISNLKLDSDGALTYKLTVNKQPVTDLTQYIGYTTTIADEKTSVVFTIIHYDQTNSPQLQMVGNAEGLPEMTGVFLGEFSNGNYKFSKISISGYEMDVENVNIIDSTWKKLTLLPDPANGHEYVDLGLPSGTLWATMNVGANNVTDYGNYYMYGKGATQYNSSDTAYAGTEDPLATSADTAAQVWGGGWHMPTKAQLDELTANTTYQWVTNYEGSNINGGLFTAQNGNSIFLPAAGLWTNGSQYDVGLEGYCWSSSNVNVSGYYYGYYFYFRNGNMGITDFNYTFGCSIRPVIG